MSGIHMLLAAGGGGVVQNINCGATNSAAGSGSSTASVTFQSDGTISGSRDMLGTAFWYQPASPGIGSQFWISIANGAWSSLASGVYTNLSGTNNSVTRSIRIAVDATGANIVATGNVTLTVSNSQ